MNKLLIKPVAIFLVTVGVFFAYSDELIAEKLNKCCATLGACCECTGPCSANFFYCECTSTAD